MRRSLKKSIIWGLIASVAAAVLPLVEATANHTPTAPVDPFSLYGNEIRFDVYRNGEKVGFHRVSFSGNKADLTVRSEFQLQITLLFLTVYNYRYQSEGRWRQGQLESLRASVDDDGMHSALDAVRVREGLRIEGGGQTFTAESPLFPTNHWNAQVLDRTRVLNTVTGKINQVRIEPRAREIVETERGDVLATRYGYTGELQTEVWYDDSGRWVKMRFEGRDGSKIEYVCRQCQGVETAARKAEG